MTKGRMALAIVISSLLLGAAAPAGAAQPWTPP